jgi:aryl-alcohol dehydrogenase-like predicted oxidoreductase
MERHRFANTDLTVSIIGLGCYGMSGAYGPADDAESIATIHRALDLASIFSTHRPAMARATIIA